MKFRITPRFENAYLGKIITITIDHPIGSPCQNSRTGLYPINFGHYQETEERQATYEAYLIGVDTPEEQYTGTVIGIVCNGNRIKLIVSKIGSRYDQVAIADSISFREPLDKITLFPLFHRSCGAIIFRRVNGRIELLLLQEAESGAWSFPKGHAEPGETERVTALREVREEIGASVSLLDGFAETIHYNLRPIGEKTVTLFLSYYGGKIKICPREIRGFRWIEINAAKHLIHNEYAPILDRAKIRAEQFLEKHRPSDNPDSH